MGQENNCENRPLKVLSASAGSGKTYNLVKTYLELILKEDTYPQNFAKIMAMTFTNKAALEMKNRIIEALNNLSLKLETRTNENKKAFDYQEAIAKDFGLKREILQEKAQTALTQILHQYEDFYVMTIDKFNLRLIRSFAMDLNLDANFKVVIDETEIIERVVDDFLEEIDKNFTGNLSKIFLELSGEKVAEGENWDFKRELTDYLKILSKEEAIELLNKTNSDELTSEAFQLLKLKIKNIQTHFEETCTIFTKDLEPLLGKVPGNAKKTVTATFNNVKKLDFNSSKIPALPFTDTMLRYLNEGTLPTNIESIIVDFREKFEKDAGELEKLIKIKQSFQYIRLLKQVHLSLQDYRQTEQIIRISEFNRMISELLKNESSDFIYEKLGTRYNHFLLDEFQDTSRLQWQNIVPLLHESISQQHPNLIVGDPKQSIYRFRGGVADQFVALPRIYNPQNDPEIARKSEYFNQMGCKEDLKDNYRSTKEIVKFNSDFFEQLIPFIKEKTGNDYSEYYESIRQNPKKERQGFIHLVSQFSKKKGADASNDDEETPGKLQPNLDFLLQSVRSCIADGYEKGDICVLGDTARLCNEYALALTQAEEKFKVFSSDSLSVDSDQSVKHTIIYLTWRNQPTNELFAKRFAEKFLSIRFPEDTVARYTACFSEKFNEEKQKPIQYFDYEKFLATYFEGKNLFEPFENLYALVEKFYQNAGFSELENPYLHHLADLAFDYDLNNGPDLQSFLDYYEKSGKKSSIQIPKNRDAIQIMTAHKSKGLEFKVVIIPQLANTFMKNDAKTLVELDNNVVYTKIKEKNYSEELSEKYQKEYAASLLDKLNLYYVAFTRPIDRLYVMSFLSQKKNINFGTIFHEFLQEPFFNNKRVQYEFNADDEKIELQFGKSEKHTSEQQEDTESFSPKDLQDRLWFPEISLRHQLIEEENDGISEQQRYGKQLHLLLSEVDKFHDFTTLINIYRQKGLVENQFVEQLSNDLKRITSDEKYRQLHADVQQIINEQSIILQAQEVKRPDKILIKAHEVVVLDYKTGLPDKKYVKQVKNYCLALEQMGYENVHGYLLYTRDLQFIPVS